MTAEEQRRRVDTAPQFRLKPLASSMDLHAAGPIGASALGRKASMAGCVMSITAGPRRVAIPDFE